VENEVRDISAKQELSRSIQARLTAGHMRFRAAIAKLRNVSPHALPTTFAGIKNLPVPILMEIDSALRRQALLLEYAKKAVALSGASSGGLMARRAAAVLDKPDAYFSRWSHCSSTAAVA
jgi:hypothetical protein